MSDLTRRNYSTQYARRKREAKLAAARVGATCCPKKYGSHRCGGPLETRIDLTSGRTSIICLWCERKARGLCLECPARVRGQSRRCEVCKHRMIRASERRSELRNRAKKRTLARERYHARPEFRSRACERKRLWRKANPDKVRAQKRRFALREGKAREKHLRYHKRYNAKKSRELRKRQMALLVYYAGHPERPVPRCLGCQRYLDWKAGPDGRRGAPPWWCDACAPAYEKARRRRIGRSIRTVDGPPPTPYFPRQAIERARKSVG
ncbi:MAG: hypothetical protein ABR543_09600, partial [Gemmatimonadaceae bacterium]